jgi:two-component system, cell cycle response regulator DivK
MSKTVMVVEDYEDTRELMKTLIQSYGYFVIEAVDGSDAVEKSGEFHLDLIFMDLAMPIMDGVAATKRIREIIKNEKVSIVALTGFANTSLEKAVEAGFDGVLIKPLHYEALEPLLNYYLA